jgi:hypothetical protein
LALAHKNVNADIDLLQRAVIMPIYDLSIHQWRYPKHGEYLAKNPLRKKKKTKKGKKGRRGGGSKSPKKASKSPKSGKKKVRANSSSSDQK